VPGPRVQQVDPFLFLNHHGPQVYPRGNRGLPFGPHPHRGFETVTFILEGELMHRDSAGYESVIRAGGVQWMTAGSGLVHAELSPEDFKRNGGPLEILQLWVNLPSRLKFTPPRYQGLQVDAIPQIEIAGGLARLALIAGEWNGAKGPVDSITGNFMSTIEASPGARVNVGGLSARSVFLYVVSGQARVNGRDVAQHTLVELDIAGDELEIEATSAARFLFGPRHTDQRTRHRARPVRHEYGGRNPPGHRRLPGRQVRIRRGLTIRAASRPRDRPRRLGALTNSQIARYYVAS
jgi:redox-sensitive bicupin YhaK (pirin superfamily)